MKSVLGTPQILLSLQNLVFSSGAPHSGVMGRTIKLHMYIHRILSRWVAFHYIRLVASDFTVSFPLVFVSEESQLIVLQLSHVSQSPLVKSKPTNRLVAFPPHLSSSPFPLRRREARLSLAKH